MKIKSSLLALAQRLAGGRTPAPATEIELARAFAGRSMEGARSVKFSEARPEGVPQPSTPFTLSAYFDAHRTGRGIWKWAHYFEIYERHLARWVGVDSQVLEIGIYSGGSLEMWRHYFGPAAHVIGVDIEEACRAYEEPGISIAIGDQEDRNFWASFRKRFPRIDVLIDDGGHTYEQQRVTLEEMLPHLQPGGVYICEDVHGTDNRFACYARALAAELNCFAAASAGSNHGALSTTPSPFQRAVGSVHFYPYVVVIEKNRHPVESFMAPKRGTHWAPFL